MGEEDDVQKALAFLRKHDVSHTGAPVAQTQQIASFDIEDLDNGLEDREPQKVGHEPVGPNWKKPGSFAQLPKLPNHPDGAWLMHERQDQTGKYKAWLFFQQDDGRVFSCE